MSRARSNASEPFANRVTSHAPRTPSSVLPVAMPSDVHRFPAVVTFARNAPSRIAGQTRGPSSSIEASAIPVGGHTAVALAWTKASMSPSLAAAK